MAMEFLWHWPLRLGNRYYTNFNTEYVASFVDDILEGVGHSEIAQVQYILGVYTLMMYNDILLWCCFSRS